MTHTTSHSHSHTHSEALPTPPAHPQAQSLFNPQQISVDIRTPEELAVVNSFLVALGRDVSAAARRDEEHQTRREEHVGGSGSGGAQVYFDASSLAQLGLAGMPGITSTPHATYSAQGAGGYPQQHLARDPPQHLFAPPGDMLEQTAAWPRPDFGLPPFRHHATPSTPSSGSGSGSGDRDTPPHDPTLDTDLNIEFGFAGMGLRRPRGPLPEAPRLAPMDHVGARYRSVAALQSAAECEPAVKEECEPTVEEAREPATEAREVVVKEEQLYPPLPLPRELDDDDDKLYPLLTSGDPAYKLPALRLHQEPAPEWHRAPPHMASPPSTPGLPGVGRIQAKIRERDRRGDDVMEVDRRSAAEHAVLVRNLLLYVNAAYRARAGEVVACADEVVACA